MVEAKLPNSISAYMGELFASNTKMKDQAEAA